MIGCKPARVDEQRPVNDKRCHSDRDQEDRKADGRLDHQPDSGIVITVCHVPVSLTVKPGKEGERKNVRNESEGAKLTGSIDQVFVQFLCFRPGKAGRPYFVCINFGHTHLL
jgi:hypothetical protein